MKLNLDAIKNKIKKINGENRGQSSSGVQLWKPNPGVYLIRGLHWPTGWTNDGEPFLERFFYYNIARYGILAPHQFGKEDPINDFRIKLFQSGDADDKQIAKKLFPRMRSYMPIVVKEASGADATAANPNEVIVWSFGGTVYEKLLGYFIEEDIGDYLDPHEGFDLKVTIKKVGGKKYFDTDVELARRPSPLAGDDEKIKALVDSIPDVREMYSLKSASEIREELEKWMSGGAGAEQPVDESDGHEKGNSKASKASSTLDDLASDLNSEVEEKAEEKVVVEKKKPVDDEPKKKKAKKVVDEDEADVSTSSLDDAFDELMNG